ncbi:hypothetical protein GC175_17495 [bacterium]|nr:hypothetical protein [bacterium]
MDDGNPCAYLPLLHYETEASTTGTQQLCRQLAILLGVDGRAVDQALAVNVLCCDLGQQRAVRGRLAALGLLHSILVDGFAQRQVQVISVDHHDAHTLIQFRFSGIQYRRLLGLPATQRHVSLAASITTTVEDAQITRIVLDYDVKELLRQLGMTK